MGLGHEHDHTGAALSAGGRHRGRLVVVFVMTAAFFVVQLVVGFAANSLAVLSDAGHMATDTLGLGMALAAVTLAQRGNDDPQRTFGLYRLEILAALANTLLLFAVAGYVIYEAVGRFRHPEEVHDVAVLVIGILGLAVNVAGMLILRQGAKESLNVHGAYLEVLADMVGSVGVIVSAVVIALTGWTYVDPIIGILIGLWILPRAWRLGGEALRILLQSAPRHTDVAAIRRDLSAIDGVVDVHDLHVWTLTSEMEVATAHVMVRKGTDSHAVLDRAQEVLAADHGIDHATLQVEPDDHVGCDELHW